MNDLTSAYPLFCVRSKVIDFGHTVEWKYKLRYLLHKNGGISMIQGISIERLSSDYEYFRYTQLTGLDSLTVNLNF